ncbi:response regulator [Maridesulfovibrio bastinii]|uniref:response regulator n=1 Tax=Maridesulfovibrio bastinii TaxID=47157 RepID=UPI00041EAF82|nr:response regulator [Maridesulfovibrio bastinii]
MEKSINKQRILFVDDEQNVLSSLRRMLRGKRNEWDMHFVQSGREALEILASMRFDVLVSDIKMPEMSGDILLEKTCELYPSIIRIALSGQVSLDEVVSGIKSVHQYISKPCSAEDLIERIESTLSMKNVVTDPALQNLLSQIDALPVLPDLYVAIEKELAKDFASIDRISELVTQDIALVAKILKLVNSPFFAFSRKIENINQAITLLGIETFKSLILSTHLFTIHDSSMVPGFSLKSLWEHSFRVSTFAALIARSGDNDIEFIGRCRMAGLLHDVGKLVLVSKCSEQYNDVLKLVREDVFSIHEAERQIFGTSHCEVGSYLLGLWGLSKDIIEGIWRHNKPVVGQGLIADIITAANMFDHKSFVFNENYGNKEFSCDMPEFKNIIEKLPVWVRFIQNNWDDLLEHPCFRQDYFNKLLDCGG